MLQVAPNGHWYCKGRTVQVHPDFEVLFNCTKLENIHATEQLKLQSNQ